MSNCCDRFVMIEGEEDSFETWQGLRGPYYTPSVSEDGTLSWTNNGDLQNPAAVNIKGPPGPGGIPGGTTGQLLAKASDEDYDTEWIDQPEMDAGHVSYDSTEAYDDGTVGKELTTINSALSSLSAVTEIIDTASGAIASFPDGSGLPMRSLVAQINPVQAGTGDPSPDNIRPITGHTGLSVEVVGANVWDEEWELGYYSANNGAKVSSNQYFRAKNLIPVFPNTQYYFVAPLRMELFEWGKDGGYLRRATNNIQNSTFTTHEDCYFITFNTYVEATTYNHDISINYPSTDTTYHAYTGTTTTVSWQDEAGTVYGGTLDVVSGLLTATMVSVDIGSWSDWRYNVGGTYAFDTRNSFVPIPKNNNCICSRYKRLEVQTASNITNDDFFVAINKQDDGSQYTGYYAAGTLIVKDTNYSDVQTFRSAMSGVQLVYELETPITYQLTPQQVETLVGQNNIWVDTGDVTVTYQASIKGYIDKVLAS